MGPFERYFHEGSIWIGQTAVISFTLTKQKILHLIIHGDCFYDRYINSGIRNKYLDDDGTGVKPG